MSVPRVTIINQNVSATSQVLQVIPGWKIAANVDPKNDISGTKVEVRNEHMLDLFPWEFQKGEFGYILMLMWFYDWISS